jgi:hypothetical protein
MAATATKLQTPAGHSRAAGSPTVRASIDAFLDSPKINRSPHTTAPTPACWTGSLNCSPRTGNSPQSRTPRSMQRCPSSGVGKAGDVESTAPLSVLSGLCADKQHWAAPALPPSAKRRREPEDTTKAVSSSRIDRLCRRTDVALREKTLRRMLSEPTSRACAVLALNIEGLTCLTSTPRSSLRVETRCGSRCSALAGHLVGAAPGPFQPR